MKKRDFDYLMALKYEVLMRKYDGVYCAFVPELSLLAEGKSASEAYEKLEQEKALYFKRLLAIDAANTVKEPWPITIRKRFQEDILLFGAKTLVVGIIFGIIALIFLPVLDVFVSTRIDPMISLGGMAKRIDDKLNNMSEKDLEEKKNLIKRIVLKVKPFTDEIKILFEDNSGHLSPHRAQ